jgi:hypothetical protein
MDRTMSSGVALGSNPSAASANAVNAKIDSAAAAAHQAADNVADKAAVQVDKLSESAHGAVNNAASATKTVAAAASNLADQAKELQAQLTSAASTSIRANPIIAVAGALAVGYLLGRIGRP